MAPLNFSPRRGQPVRTLVCVIAFVVGTANADEPTSRSQARAELPAALARLLPLHTKLGPPQPGDWLAEHKEPGQSYAQYLRSRPIRVDRQRRVIYVQPLGEFDSAQRKVLDRTAEFLGIYFQLPVKVRDDLSLDVIPAAARREHPTWHVKQILSTYVLDKVLRPRLPADACAYIALTTSDLWPGEGWNFVFGQASLSERVGVWSIARNGDPHGGDAGFRLCLLRTLEDRLARDGAHVLDAALHVVRVQHVRQQPSGGSGPPPLVALPSLPGEALPRHRGRSRQTIQGPGGFQQTRGT